MGLQVLVGIVIIWQTSVIRAKLKTRQRVDAVLPTCSGRTMWAVNILTIAGALMILTPLIVLGVSMTGNYARFKAVSALEDTFKAQIIAFVASGVVFALVVWLNIELRRCGESIGILLWAAVIINAAGSGGLVLLRNVLDRKAIMDANNSLSARAARLANATAANAAAGIGSLYASAPSLAQSTGNLITGTGRFAGSLIGGTGRGLYSIGSAFKSGLKGQ